MKAITLHQPWASLMALGAKRIETRSWAPPASMVLPFRLAIHAGRSDAGFRLAPEVVSLARAAYNLDEAALRSVMGCVLCVVTVVRVERTEQLVDSIDVLERDCGDFSPGRFGWVTEGRVGLRPAMPARGRQGLWDVSLKGFPS